MKWLETLQRKWQAKRKVFVLYGNVFDRYETKSPSKAVALTPFLCNELMKNCLVLSFNPADGLSFQSQEDKAEFYKWMESYDLTEKTNHVTSGKPIKDFGEAISIFRRFVDTYKDGKKEICFIIEFANMMFANESLSQDDKSAVVNLLSVFAMNLSVDSKYRIVLISESLDELNKDIINSNYVSTVQVEFPDLNDRISFLSNIYGTVLSKITDVKLEEFAKKLSGMNIVQIHYMLQEHLECGGQITFDIIAKEKKKIIERFCHGLVYFKEPNPKMSLDSVATHKLAKAKLRQIVRFIKEGKEKAVEKGILLPGRVGVGKSYLVDCFASECGIPVMVLGEFRSKWVGDTEKQLSRILMTIKALGPVIVVVDEADAVFGNRESSGDSGVSSRVFATLAAHIGDSSTRGKELWIAMTSRPDLLPIDMKRMGRFGLCIPLFPAMSNDDVEELFVVQGKIRGIEITDKMKELIRGDASINSIDSVFYGYTGSEVETIMIRAEENAIIRNVEKVEMEDLKDAIDSFVDPLDKELLKKQGMAAIEACSDVRLLPDEVWQLKNGQSDV